MTYADKLANLKVLLSDGGALPSDEKLGVYLTLAGREILQWMYSLVGGVPEDVTEVPPKYTVTQIYAVLAGYTHAGAEGERQHNENGVNRVFNSTDMLDYIHQNVTAIARVGAVNEL